MKYKTEITMGYDFGLNPRDSYSKEKGMESVKLSLEGDEIDRESLNKEARRLVKELVEDIRLILKEGGEEIKLSVEELRNTRNPEIDKLRVELDEKYKGYIKELKEEIIKLKNNN